LTFRHTTIISTTPAAATLFLDLSTGGTRMYRFATLAALGVMAGAVAGCQTGGGSPAASASPATSSAGASAAELTVALEGDFHPVDGDASGTVQLAQLADGSYEIVLESFEIGSAEHLNLVLVKADDVTSTTDVDPDAFLDLGALEGTSGMQVYPIPADMEGGVMDYGTAVIWDEPMGHAVAAAPLGQP
jgi:Electron transfer DM13